MLFVTKINIPFSQIKVVEEEFILSEAFRLEVLCHLVTGLHHFVVIPVRIQAGLDNAVDPGVEEGDLGVPARDSFPTPNTS